LKKSEDRFDKKVRTDLINRKLVVGKSEDRFDKK